MGNAILDALFNENEESVSESHNVNDLQFNQMASSELNAATGLSTADSTIGEDDVNDLQCELKLQE